MSKGRDRPGKEKRKPKAEKNKKPKHVPLAGQPQHQQPQIGIQSTAPAPRKA